MTTSRTMKVYLVYGQCGEYSDHTDWIVKAFLSKEKAEALEHECLLWTARNQGKYRDIFNWNEQEAFGKTSPDPHYRTSYTGTDYHTIEVDVEE